MPDRSASRPTGRFAQVLLASRLISLTTRVRTTPAHCSQNLPWGTGDTPITETLKLMQKAKYPFVGVIEMEHPIPQGSDLMTELAKCVEFCKNALTA